MTLYITFLNSLNIMWTLIQHNVKSCAVMQFCQNDWFSCETLSYWYPFDALIPIPALSVVWCQVTGISAGRVPCVIYRWPVAMLFSGWTLLSICQDDSSCNIDLKGLENELSSKFMTTDTYMTTEYRETSLNWFITWPPDCSCVPNSSSYCDNV